MARLVRVIWRRTVLVQVARTTRAMTLKQRFHRSIVTDLSMSWQARPANVINPCHDSLPAQARP
jgi:hypothetical protein